MVSRNWDEKQLNTELENRKKVLEYMAEKEMDEYEIVSLIRSYYADAGKTMKFVRNI